MWNLKGLGTFAISAMLAGCCHPPSTATLEGVPIEKVIAQIKADLAKTNIAAGSISGANVFACDGSDKPFALIRSADPTKQPTVTVKLQSVDGIDGTVDAGVAKLPITPVVLFSADVSYEDKRLVTREQDITFNILTGPIVKDPSDMSELGKAIYQAEDGVLHSDHSLKPCLQPAHLEVSLTVDVTKTKAANGTVGFLVLYSVTGKASLSAERKNQIVVDINYALDTPAAFH